MDECRCAGAGVFHRKGADGRPVTLCTRCERPVVVTPPTAPESRESGADGAGATIGVQPAAHPPASALADRIIAVYRTAMDAEAEARRIHDALTDGNMARPRMALAGDTLADAARTLGCALQQIDRREDGGRE